MAETALHLFTAPRSTATAIVHQLSHSSRSASCNNHFQMLHKNVLLSLSTQVTQLQSLEGKFLFSPRHHSIYLSFRHCFFLGQKVIFVCHTCAFSCFINIKVLIKWLSVFSRSSQAGNVLCLLWQLISKTLFLWCIKNQAVFSTKVMINLCNVWMTFFA